MILVQMLLGVVSVALGLVISLGIIYGTVIAGYKLADAVLTKALGEMRDVAEFIILGHKVNLMDVGFTLMFTLGFTLLELHLMLGLLNLVEHLS